MRYGTMGPALPGRFRCVCGNQHPIRKRSYIELESNEYPVGCKNGKEIVEGISYYCKIGFTGRTCCVAHV